WASARLVSKNNYDAGTPTIFSFESRHSSFSPPHSCCRTRSFQFRAKHGNYSTLLLRSCWIQTSNALRENLADRSVAEKSVVRERRRRAEKPKSRGCNLPHPRALRSRRRFGGNRQENECKT